VPDFLDRLDVEVEGVGKSGLGETRRHARTQGTHRHFQEREPLVGREPIKIISKHNRRIGTGQGFQPFNDRPQRQIDFTRHGPLRPEQGNRLRTVSDIIAAHTV
jgi:hypothetical protein